MKVIDIYDFLTHREIMDVKDIFVKTKESDLHDKLIAFIEPRMDKINEKLGQENHSGYLAYALEYTFGRDIEMVSLRLRLKEQNEDVTS